MQETLPSLQPRKKPPKPAPAPTNNTYDASLPSLGSTRSRSKSPVTRIGFQELSATLSNTEELLKSLKSKAFSQDAQRSSRRYESAPRPQRRQASELPSSEPISVGHCTSESGSAAQSRIQEHFTAFQATMNGTMNSLTSALAKKSSPGAPTTKITAKNFTVGKTHSTASSIMSLFPDRLEYYFQHASGRILMVMYYRDLQCVAIDRRKCSCRFHVSRALRHFGSEYDPDNSDHLVAFTFCSVTEMEVFELTTQGHGLEFRHS